MLCAEAEADELELVDYRLAPHPPFAGLARLDTAAVTCSYANGTRPFGLHHVLKEKPWLTIRRPSLYSRLLPRLWLADDLPIRLSPKQIPVPFRSGLAASVARWGAYTQGDLKSLRSLVGNRVRVHANGRESPRREAPKIANAECWCP